MAAVLPLICAHAAVVRHAGGEVVSDRLWGTAPAPQELFCCGALLADMMAPAGLLPKALHGMQRQPRSQLALKINGAHCSVTRALFYRALPLPRGFAVGDQALKTLKHYGDKADWDWQQTTPRNTQHVDRAATRAATAQESLSCRTAAQAGEAVGTHSRRRALGCANLNTLGMALRTCPHRSITTRACIVCGSSQRLGPHRAWAAWF